MVVSADMDLIGAGLPCRPTSTRFYTPVAYYGDVAASDPNHPNPVMLTGRQFDIETGPPDLPAAHPAGKRRVNLYYYRAFHQPPAEARWSGRANNTGLTRLMWRKSGPFDCAQSLP